MAYNDLREFLQLLEKEGELARVRPQVDLRYELSAVCRQALDTQGLENNKALLFESPGGYVIPVVANLLTTRRRLALALGAEAGRLRQRLLEAAKSPLEPKIVGSGPCQEVILTGEDVDLLKFPLPTWNELDPAPYITAACHISRDTETGARNMGVYRAMVHDKRHLGILAAPYRHIAIQCRKAHEKNQAFPVALCLGADPSVYVAAQFPLPLGEDELALAGALRGQSLELVKCKTIDLEVPATSEIVLEGEIIPGMLKEEGPFGEFTGYYGGGRALRPVITVKAITHRRDCIFHAAYQGRPPNDTSITFLVSNEAEILRTVSLPGLRSIHLKEGGMSLVAVASVKKLYDGYGKVMGCAILSTEVGRLIKTLIVVDEDIDPFNDSQVYWALGTRFQPAKDLVLLEGLPGVTLDPSLPIEEREKDTNRTSKLILDGTRPEGFEFPPEARPPEEIIKRVTKRWADYGLA